MPAFARSIAIRVVFCLFAAALVSFMPAMSFAQTGKEAVRPAYCAGTWYPGDVKALTQTVDDLLKDSPAPQMESKPIALIAPHAGYRYSAPTSAAAYRCLKGHTYHRVIVLAFSHRNAGRYTGVDVPEGVRAFETPLGQVKLDEEVCKALLQQPGFASHAGVDRGEHSLELQLPFLQRTAPDTRLVPLYVGRVSEAQCTDLAKALLPWIDDDTLIVASTDFTHFGPNYGYQPFKEDMKANLLKLADQAAAPILLSDYDGFVQHCEKTGDTICGQGPLRLLFRILSMRGGADGTRTAIDTSGRLTNDWTNSVTYQSFVFCRRASHLKADERAMLLKLARDTVTAQLADQPIPSPKTDCFSEILRAKGACFVTLQNHGELRGCIGNMIADKPLYQSVIDNAVLACQDYRFVRNPVTTGELKNIDIEISYLTPMKRVKDVSEIVVGRHGLLMSLGGQRGVLLPQVAYERGWTRETFLGQTCRKAGLPLDAWKRPEAEIHSFEAEVFGENHQEKKGAIQEKG